MGRARAAGWLATAAAVLTGAGAAAAQVDPSTTARLQGQFALTGQITVAVRIRGEHAGQRVLRSWTFTPLCPTGGCEQVELVRQRQRGTDSVVLNLQSPDYYVGHGRFFAPVRCGGRRHARGTSVPFTISVQITGARIVSGSAVATQVQASYVNPQRVNRSRCVTIPGHDAATYTGTLA
jgi:hypothetical protein